MQNKKKIKNILSCTGGWTWTRLIWLRTGTGSGNLQKL